MTDSTARPQDMLRRILRLFLRELLARPGWTHRRIAEALGISRPAVSALLAARQGPNLTTLARILRVYPDEWRIFQGNHPIEAGELARMFRWTQLPAGQTMLDKTKRRRSGSVTMKELLTLRRLIERVAAKWGPQTSPANQAALDVMMNHLADELARASRIPHADEPRHSARAAQDPAVAAQGHPRRLPHMGPAARAGRRGKAAPPAAPSRPPTQAGEQ